LVDLTIALLKRAVHFGQIHLASAITSPFGSVCGVKRGFVGVPQTVQLAMRGSRTSFILITYA